MYGHTKGYCRRQHRCVKCGDEHIPRTAPNPEILQLNAGYALKTTHPTTRAAKSIEKYYKKETQPHKNHTGTEQSQRVRTQLQNNIILKLLPTVRQTEELTQTTFKPHVQIQTRRKITAPIGNESK